MMLLVPGWSCVQHTLTGPARQLRANHCERKAAEAGGSPPTRGCLPEDIAYHGRLGERADIHVLFLLWIYGLVSPGLLPKGCILVGGAQILPLVSEVTKRHMSPEKTEHWGMDTTTVRYRAP